jgi:hypothetical protein
MVKDIPFGPFQNHHRWIESLLEIINKTPRDGEDVLISGFWRFCNLPLLDTLSSFPYTPSHKKVLSDKVKPAPVF